MGRGAIVRQGFVIITEGTNFGQILAGWGADDPRSRRLDAKVYESFTKLLEKHGWRWESITGWAYHVFPAQGSLRTSNPCVGIEVGDDWDELEGFDGQIRTAGNERSMWALAGQPDFPEIDRALWELGYNLEEKEKVTGFALVAIPDDILGRYHKAYVKTTKSNPAHRLHRVPQRAGNPEAQYRVAYLVRAVRTYVNRTFTLPQAQKAVRWFKYRGYTAWVEDAQGKFVPIKGVTRQPGFRENPEVHRKWVIKVPEKSTPVTFAAYAEAMDGIDGNDTRRFRAQLESAGFPARSPVRLPMQGCEGMHEIVVYRSREEWAAAKREGNPVASRHREAYESYARSAELHLKAGIELAKVGRQRQAAEALRHAECDVRQAFTEASYGKRNDADMRRMTTRLERVYSHLATQVRALEEALAS